MFDMQKIGKRIISFRKKCNLTQLELADKMGISFQAISGWERGISMPDISKLPELAQIFNVSIDELIGEKSDFIEAVVNDDVDTYLKSEAFSSDEVAEAVPLLKPDQAEQVIGKLGTDIFSNIQLFLPYMNESDVKEFALMALENGENVSEYLDYMDEDDVSEIAMRALEKGESVAEYLDYMCEDDVAKLAMKALENGKSITEYLDYMTEDDVKKLALRIIKKGKN